MPGAARNDISARGHQAALRHERTLSYRVEVHVQAICDAYSSMSKQYIGLVGDGSQEHEHDMSLVRRHLAGLAGSVLDLGCGPGHWTCYLHSLGAEVTGVDMVPEFVAHARATYPGLTFRQGSMTELDVPDHSVAGILTWYSTIHLSPSELDGVLTDFRRPSRPTADRLTSSPRGFPGRASQRSSVYGGKSRNAPTVGTPRSQHARPDPWT